jgi:hypothetical protein
LVADVDPVAITVAIRLPRREFQFIQHLVENRIRVISRHRPRCASGSELPCSHIPLHL